MTLGSNKVLSIVVFFHLSFMNLNWGFSFYSIVMTITQNILRYKTKVSHKHVVVIYHRNTPLPKVWKGLRWLHTHTHTHIYQKCERAWGQEQLIALLACVSVLPDACDVLLLPSKPRPQVEPTCLTTWPRVLPADLKHRVASRRNSERTARRQEVHAKHFRSCKV
jgi:hypothetical protein